MSWQINILTPKELLLFNGMAFDFNVGDYNVKNKDKSFAHFLKYLDSMFDFVLVNELYDEGLILLRRSVFVPGFLAFFIYHSPPQFLDQTT